MALSWLPSPSTSPPSPLPRPLRRRQRRDAPAPPPLRAAREPPLCGRAAPAARAARINEVPATVLSHASLAMVDLAWPGPELEPDPGGSTTHPLWMQVRVLNH